MKKTDKISYLQKDPTELQKLLKDARIKLVESRSKYLTGNLKDTSVFRKIKYEIALISSILTQNDRNKK